MKRFGITLFILISLLAIFIRPGFGCAPGAESDKDPNADAEADPRENLTPAPGGGGTNDEEDENFKLDDGNVKKDGEIIKDGSKDKPKPKKEPKESILDKIFGYLAKVEPYGAPGYRRAGGGPVPEEGLLDCDFEDECCYKNANRPEDELNWGLVGGEIDTDRVFRYFNTQAPDGNFLVVASQSSEDPFAEARLKSCTIHCTDQPVTVSLKHWATEDVKIKVCTQKAFKSDLKDVPLLDCKTLNSKNSPGPSTVRLPAGEIFDIVIVASNFLYGQGGIALIDDIQVDYELCREEGELEPDVGPAIIPNGGDKDEEATTQEPIELATPAPTTQSPLYDFQTLCQLAECDFEQGLCGYEVLKSTGANTGKWVVYSGKFRNPLTGVRRPNPGTKGTSYATTYLKPGQAAGMQVEFPDRLDEAIMFTFYLYEATQGQEVNVCCDSFDNCPYSSKMDANRRSRYWRRGRVACRGGAKRVIFVCRNTGINQGACALDDFKIFDANTEISYCANTNPLFLQ